MEVGSGELLRHQHAKWLVAWVHRAMPSAGWDKDQVSCLHIQVLVANQLHSLATDIVMHRLPVAMICGLLVTGRYHP